MTKRFTLTRAVLTGALLGCAEEFANEPPIVPQYDVAGWPDTLATADIDTLEIIIGLSGEQTAIGLEVDWRSSNPAALEVFPATPPTGTREDTLRSRMNAIVLARGRDTAVTITATIDRLGFARVTISRAITVMERWTGVSVGGGRTCALTISKDAYCWGTEQGLSPFEVDSATIPTHVRGDQKFVTIATGRGTACGRSTNGLTYCWGSNAYGTLGDNTQLSRRTPAPVVGGDFESVDVGGEFACGVRENNTAQCWGSQMSGQLGQGPVFPTCIPYSDFTLYCRPGLVSGAEVRVNITEAFFNIYCDLAQPFFSECTLEVLTLSAGENHACAISKHHAVLCWGASGSGQLGGPSIGIQCSVVTGPAGGPCSSWPTLAWTDTTWFHAGLYPYTGPRFQSVTAGTFHSCALTTAGSAYCWGGNSQGQLGDGSHTSSRFPVAGSSRTTFSTISAGYDHTCAIGPQGRAWCWGGNDEGQLGRGTVGSNSATAAAVLDDHQFLKLSAGFKSTCGVTSPTGAIYCWGRRLGNGTTDHSGVPTRVSEPTLRPEPQEEGVQPRSSR